MIIYSHNIQYPVIVSLWCLPLLCTMLILQGSTGTNPLFSPSSIPPNHLLCPNHFTDSWPSYVSSMNPFGTRIVDSHYRSSLNDMMHQPPVQIPPSLCAPITFHEDQKSAEIVTPTNVLSNVHLTRCSGDSSPLNNVTRSGSGQLIECPFKGCDRIYQSESTMKAHYKVHTNPKVCSKCNKAFQNTSKLKAHERSHTGEKPFRCRYCEKAFSDRSNLKRHERIHTVYLLSSIIYTVYMRALGAHFVISVT